MSWQQGLTVNLTVNLVHLECWKVGCGVPFAISQTTYDNGKQRGQALAMLVDDFVRVSRSTAPKEGE